MSFWSCSSNLLFSASKWELQYFTVYSYGHQCEPNLKLEKHTARCVHTFKACPEIVKDVNTENS